MQTRAFARSNVWSFVAVFALALAARAQSVHDVALSGEAEVRGRIERTENPDVFRIGGRSFRFAPGLTVDGYAFDGKSRESFVGKDVQAVLKTTPAGAELTAVLPDGLYSTAPFALTDRQSKLFAQTFREDGARFAGSPLSEPYQSPESFRVTLRESRPVRPGETALLLTFSGAQGVDPGAALGHFAFGQAVVQADGSLKGDVSNFYPVVNRKNIVPGHVPLADYFGNVSTGQAQYRPTFTLIVYGVSPEALADARTRMDRVFEYLKKHLDFKFSANFNCATESCDVLKKSKIEVNKSPETLAQAVLDGVMKALDVRERQSDRVKKFLYFLLKDSAAFLPRKTFERSLENLLRDGAVGGQRVSRVDYVFQGQTPSRRPRGGLAPGGVIDYAKLIPFVKAKGPAAAAMCGRVF